MNWFNVNLQKSLCFKLFLEYKDIWLSHGAVQYEYLNVPDVLFYIHRDHKCTGHFHGLILYESSKFPVLELYIHTDYMDILNFLLGLVLMVAGRWCPFHHHVVFCLCICFSLFFLNLVFCLCIFNFFNFNFINGCTKFVAGDSWREWYSSQWLSKKDLEGLNLTKTYQNQNTY